MVAKATLTFRGRVDDVAYGCIHLLRSQGKTLPEIAETLRLSRATVQRWAQRDEPPSRAGKRKGNVAATRRIERRRNKVRQAIMETTRLQRVRVSPVRKYRTPRQEVLRRYPSAAQVARLLTNVSARTVVRDLRAMKFKLYSPGCGPKLDQHAKDTRVAFCKKVLAMPASEISKIVFTDEKYFDSQTKRKMRVWSPTHREVPVHSSVQGEPKTQVLGFIGKNLKIMEILPKGKTVTFSVYGEYLAKNARQLKGRILVQDNATPHQKATKRKLIPRGLKLLPFPPWSPDLNPIETLWALAARDVRQRAPFGEVMLTRFVQESLDGVPQSTVDGLCESFVERCRVCVAKRGALVMRNDMLEHRRGVRTAGKKGGK
jgi:transposase